MPKINILGPICVDGKYFFVKEILKHDRGCWRIPYFEIILLNGESIYTTVYTIPEHYPNNIRIYGDVSTS